MLYFKQGFVWPLIEEYLNICAAVIGVIFISYLIDILAFIPKSYKEELNKAMLTKEESVILQAK